MLFRNLNETAMPDMNLQPRRKV